MASKWIWRSSVEPLSERLCPAGNPDSGKENREDIALALNKVAERDKKKTQDFGRAGRPASG
jgi:hypothetical protein